MPKTARTHVLLHPYGTADGFKQVKASNDPAALKRVVDSYQRAGWAGSIYQVKATSFDDAIDRLVRRIHPDWPPREVGK